MQGLPKGSDFGKGSDFIKVVDTLMQGLPKGSDFGRNNIMQGLSFLQKKKRKINRVKRKQPIQKDRVHNDNIALIEKVF